MVLHTRSDSKVMRLIFFWLYWQYHSPPTYRQPFTLILPLSRLAVAWLCNDSLWSWCLTCQDVFANLVTKMEAWNIAQRYAIFFVLNSVRVPPQHMENFSRPLEMMQCQEHKPFAGTKCFLKAEPLLKMSSAADDH